MALTRFFDDQIQSAVLTGSPITAGRGQFLALAGEFRKDNLRIFDMARVAMPAFNEYIGQQYNATPLTFINDTDFNNYCTHLVCMSAADEPLFVIKLKNGIRLSPGQSFTIPEESIYTETFDFLQENSLRVFDTETLSYRAITFTNSALISSTVIPQVTSYALSSSSSSLLSIISDTVRVYANASGTADLGLVSSANGILA